MDYEKKADNKEVENKEPIKNNKELEKNKDKLKELDQIEEDFISLSKGIEKCVSLLKESARGGEIFKKLDRISEDNVINLNNSLQIISEQKDEVKADIRRIQNTEEK